MTTVALYALVAIIGYLIGGIPNGYLIGRLVRNTDVRTQGSGKSGATNVKRLLGWKWFFVVLLLDALKGAISVAIALWIFGGTNHWAEAIAGGAAILGHSWPVYLRFKGGRGVATAMGAMLIMLPQALAIGVLVGAAMILLFRYASLGSLIGTAIVAVSTLVIVLGWHQPLAYFIFAALATGFIWTEHRDNLVRLFSGTERKI